MKAQLLKQEVYSDLNLINEIHIEISAELVERILFFSKDVIDQMISYVSCPIKVYGYTLLNEADFSKALIKNPVINISYQDVWFSGEIAIADQPNVESWKSIRQKIDLFVHGKLPKINV